MQVNRKEQLWTGIEALEHSCAIDRHADYTLPEVHQAVHLVQMLQTEVLFGHVLLSECTSIRGDAHSLLHHARLADEVATGGLLKTNDHIQMGVIRRINNLDFESV